MWGLEDVVMNACPVDCIAEISRIECRNVILLMFRPRSYFVRKACLILWKESTKVRLGRQNFLFRVAALCAEFVEQQFRGR